MVPPESIVNVEPDFTFKLFAVILKSVLPPDCISIDPLVSYSNCSPLLVSAFILHVIISPIFVH